MTNSLQIQNLSIGTQIAWSVWAKSTGTAILHTEANGGAGSKDIQLGSDWTRISSCGVPRGTGVLYFWNNTPDSEIDLCLPKIELGSIATQWCPAPEDYVAKSDFDNKVNVDAPMYRSITNDDTWVDILGAENNDQNRALVSFRDNANGNGPTIGGGGSGIAFGGSDTKGVLSVGWYSHSARIAGGNSDKPVWHEDIAWKSDIQYLKQTMLKCVPHVNLLQNSAGPFFPQPDPKSSSQQTDVNAIDQWQVFLNSTVTLVKGETYTVSAATNGVFSNNHDPNNASNKCVIWIGPPISMVISGENTSANTFTWNSDTGTYPIKVNRYGKDSQVKCWNVKIEHGSQATDWTPCPLDS